VTELNQKPDQTERIAVTGKEPPPAHLTHPESEWKPLVGFTAQGQEGPRSGSQSETMDTAEPTLPAPSESGRRRKGQPVANDSTAISTLLDEANAALPDAPKHVPTGTKDDGPVPTLTQVQIHSIEKRRRQQARAQQSKKSTACFHFSTPILVSTPDGACWTPIFQAEKGDIVIQSLPSGKIEDLTGALMTKIETICTFACPTVGIDIVRMGKALITAHHHIQTAEGWMTARC